MGSYEHWNGRFGDSKVVFGIFVVFRYPEEQR